jgi:hypothetical protein
VTESACANQGGDYQGDDTACSPNPCVGPTCQADYVVNAPYTSPQRSTCGAGNSCGLRHTEEHIYQITIPSSGEWTFSLCGSAYDTYLFVGTTCCGDEIDSNDDSCGLGSEITANLTAGTYYVTVEGFGGCGAYELNVFGGGGPVGACCVNGNTCNTGVTQSACASQGGVWQGANTTSCSNCPATGACCLTPTSCQQISESQCTQQGGTWRGANVSCNAISCETCPNGNCDQGETPCNCPQDCGEPPSSETNCSDGIDNDCDGLIDSLDDDCFECENGPDSDNDGVCDSEDDCPGTRSCAEVDANGCPSDDDGDLILNGCDNCRGVANPGQEDSDGNGVGNACEPEPPPLPCPDGTCGPICGVCVPLGMLLTCICLIGAKFRYRRRRRASP